MSFTQFVAMVALALVPSFNAMAEAAPVRVPATFNKVYVPNGFDSNDQVQIVGEGLFRNTCYRHTQPTVTVNHETKQILVGPAAYEYSGFCLQVVLPFERVLDVGILKTGTYEILQTTDKTKLGAITIKPALTDSPDDYLYAPISQAFFRQQGLTSEIYLTGDFPNSCMSLDNVQVDVQKDAIVVLPITKLEQRGDCQSGQFHFDKLVKVDFIKPGRYMLHVRSMNGKAVNNLVDIK